MMIGGFLYPLSEFATPPAQLCQRLGYQADSAAATRGARQLMVVAGYAQALTGVDFLVRDIATFKLWTAAMQAMLRDALRIEHAADGIAPGLV
jgi:hypothetical protein